MAVRRIFQREDDKWAWHLEADGEIIATDGDEGYDNEDDARSMADRIVGGEFKDAAKRVRRRKE